MHQSQNLGEVHLVFRHLWEEEKAGLEDELLSQGGLQCTKQAVSPRGSERSVYMGNLSSLGWHFLTLICVLR